ncbi:homeobox protein engrailed-1-like [Schistocerca nitens]|uniref:homeobox protein engrailed-1-like n=1 Tax=Schistocerca nitens TaxID=7011 RepID=UPI0021187B27|nr:homeobox protein engrailed-1-like [Schistocerca nitens]
MCLESDDPQRLSWARCGRTVALGKALPAATPARREAGLNLIWALGAIRRGGGSSGGGSGGSGGGAQIASVTRRLSPAAPPISAPSSGPAPYPGVPPPPPTPPPPLAYNQICSPRPGAHLAADTVRLPASSTPRAATTLFPDELPVDTLTLAHGTPTRTARAPGDIS